MLRAIRKIKGLGVFDDFSTPNNFPQFKRFNVIYGENGAGKTTLSRLFSSLDSGGHADYPNLEYTVGTDSGNLSEGQKGPTKIRVFNSDYVEANIGLFDGPMKHILIVGEENRTLAEEVKREQSTFDTRTILLEAETKACEKLEADRGKIFSSIAKTIGEATSGATLRSYRKPDAEEAFSKLTHPKACNEKDLEVCRTTLRQQQAEKITNLTFPELNASGSSEPLPLDVVASEYVELVQALTLKTAQAGALKRLAEHGDISDWVEEGLRIHREHVSEKCEFCAQVIPAGRLNAIAEHFAAEDQKLKEEIEAAKALGRSIEECTLSVSLPPKISFYEELRDSYQEAVVAYASSRRALAGDLESIQAALSQKMSERSKSYQTSHALEVSAFIEALRHLQSLIDRHNEKTDAFETEKIAARNVIEEHYLSTIVGQVEELDSQIRNKKNLIQRLTNGHAELDDPRGLAELLRSIAEKKARVSNAHAGGVEMTRLLRNFLGRTDLTFESDDEGYRVQRRGKSAKKLSEGEKTAVAFLYFIVQLRDQDFDVANGIVVIDDPVSSLDSSSIYQAFAFLKNAVAEAKQVFLFTHNFDFLKLLINWLNNTGKGGREYFMIVCAEVDGARLARIERLDELLVKHPTEYHYLFKTLYLFKSDGTILSCYNIPNVARKLLETFLEFYVPSNESPYKKLERVNFDEQKKTAIYKFANDLSHRTGKGFDPALVAETQKNTKYLLEMIETVAPSHYEGLKKLAES